MDHDDFTNRMSDIKSDSYELGSQKAMILIAELLYEIGCSLESAVDELAKLKTLRRE